MFPGTVIVPGFKPIPEKEMKTNPNDPAGIGINRNEWGVASEGLTKREYFASMALQGLLSGRNADVSAETLAKQSIMAADALIDELNKTSKP